MNLKKFQLIADNLNKQEHNIFELTLKYKNKLNK